MGERGDAALVDGRHGHASKLHPPIRAWLDAYCRGAPSASGPTVQAALRERFGLDVSVRHLNRVRAALGVSKVPPRTSVGGAGGAATSLVPPAREPAWQEGAGGLLLLAAAHETGLLPALDAAIPCDRDDDSTAHAHGARTRALLLTLLFLNAVGLRRTWDLRGYVGDALALLTGRDRAYGYRHVEHVLSDLARASAADPLTDALVTWTIALWRRRPTLADPVGAPPPIFYIDGHRKPVYSDRLIPRGLVARRGAVLGCRALTLLHDADGHPLLATTDRGDTHLTMGAPALLARLARATDTPPVRRLVIDREGMAAAFLARLADDDCDVVTVLRADQYAGLASFADVGPFVPFQYDRDGALVREVAPARFALALPDHPGEHLDVRVALVRDLRAHVPGPQPSPNPHVPYAWLEDLDPTDTAWYREGWTATPAPAALTAPKLIPIVTTAADADMDAAALARAYFDRWPRQENIIKDWLLPLGLDTNHGYAKTPVENSEVTKRRAVLEKRRAHAKRWAHGARVRYDRATKRYARFWEAARERERTLYDAMDRDVWDLQKRDAPEQVYRAEAKARKAAIDAEVATILQRAYKAHDAYRAEWDKCERYCKEQRTLLRELEDLAARERAMHELDNAKDQVMTTLKVTLTNLGMWTRDQWFPATYAHATWRRLEPFFRLPGRIVYGRRRSTSRCGPSTTGNSTATSPPSARRWPARSRISPTDVSSCSQSPA